jgi:hypothetical protein
MPSREHMEKVYVCIARAERLGMVRLNSETGLFQATQKAVEYHAPRIERAKEEIRGK